MRWLAANSVRALLVAISILGATAVGAIAYWQGEGSGTATTAVATSGPLSFSPGTPTVQLYPGGDADVATVVANPNPYVVQIGSLVADTSGGGPFAADAGHSGCGVSALSFVSQDNHGAGWSVPARIGTTDGTLAIDMPAAIKMSAAAADGCQGATFIVRLEGRS